MSAWKIWRDCGEWFVSEIGELYVNCETFATESEAVVELRRLQMNDVLAAERDVEIANARLQEKRQRLAAPPKVRRMGGRIAKAEP